MKIRLSQQSGSVLVVSLIISLLLGLTLLSVLNMVSNERGIISRTETWNSAMPIAEAGIEDAMAHLNYGGAASLGADGWTLNGENYTRQTNFGGGYYLVNMTTSMPPVITSTGYLPIPLKSTNVNRQVQVKTKRNGRFPKALLAKGGITMKGIATIDSFNSTNALNNTLGKYDPTKRTANAEVVSAGTTPGIIDLGGGDIYGSVRTGPGGSISRGGGSVGDLAWVDNPINGGNIQEGHSSSDVTVDIPDVILPFSPAAASTPTAGSFNGTNFAYALGNGDFVLPGLKISSDAVLVTGTARLYINGSMDMSGQSYFYLAPGASLEIYLGGPSAKIGGGGIVNDADGASKLSIYGLPGLTSLQYAGSAKFTGTVYAPEADFSFVGGADFTGAAVANSFSMVGAVNIHYDEALGGPSGASYIITSWRELWDGPKS